MGNEALVDYADATTRAKVKAHLDGQHLQLSGAKKLKVPLASVTSATARKGVLSVRSGNISFTLALGEAAATLWAKKILNPPSLASKLGIKADTTVAMLGRLPPEIVEAGAAGSSSRHLAKMPSAFAASVSLVALPLAKEEATIKAVATRLEPDDAVWFVYEKGTPFNGDMVIAAARKSGLKDTKVSRVSDTHAALRFVLGASQ